MYGNMHLTAHLIPVLSTDRDTALISQLNSLYGHVLGDIHSRPAKNVVLVDQATNANPFAPHYAINHLIPTSLVRMQCRCALQLLGLLKAVSDMSTSVTFGVAFHM